MNLLIVGDIHHRIDRAEYICKKFPDHKKIFIGDYFDDFNDTLSDAQRTAFWLKESLNKEDRVHLFGNHDFPYYVNSSDGPLKVFCSGFSRGKLAVIERILSPEDWGKLKYFHHENGWFFSHAGFTQHWWADPLSGEVTLDRINTVLEESLIQLKSGQEPDAIWAADFFRGGRHRYGGILWNDWNNLAHIPNFWQVVGHTPNNHISVREDPLINSKKIRIDCFLKEVLEIDESGTFTKILDLDLG
jgi:hypothetical protein